MAELTTDPRLLRDGIAAVWVPRDVVRVDGPEAEAWLQGQLSQDVATVRAGEAAWSFLLQPTGKVDALVRIARTDAATFVLDTDAGWGDAVMARLQRFKLRTKAELDRPAGWRMLAVRGAAAVGFDPAPTGAAVAADPHWPGVHGVDLLGPDLAVPDGVPECSLDAYEALRIEAGVPVMGAELTDATIPAEAGAWVVDRAVSFTKGCYTGQELVARIDSRGGHVPRPLRGLVVDGDAAPPAGATVVAGDREVGRVTSVARSATLDTVVALAVVHRDVEPPATVEVRWDGAGARAEVRDLPLVG
jgi:folate-binding protein YgfZ